MSANIRLEAVFTKFCPLNHAIPTLSASEPSALTAPTKRGLYLSKICAHWPIILSSYRHLTACCSLNRHVLMMTLNFDITGFGRISFIVKRPGRLLHILSRLGSEPKYMGPSLYYQLLHFVKVQINVCTNPPSPEGSSLVAGCTESNRLLRLCS